eukprot:3514178-Pyramimonas_sp.AAC.1
MLGGAGRCRGAWSWGTKKGRAGTAEKARVGTAAGEEEMGHREPRDRAISASDERGAPRLARRAPATRAVFVRLCGCAVVRKCGCV